MAFGFFLGEEEAGGFYHILGADFVPLEVGGIFLGGDADLLAVHGQGAVLYVSLNGAFEAAVHGVVFQHVCHVIHRAEVVDAYYFDVISLDGCTENEPSDAAKSIDTYFCHYRKSLKG